MLGKMKEWWEKGYFINPWKIIKGIFDFLPLIAVILRHPSMLIGAKKARRQTLANIEPIELPYNIPEYKDGMPYCNSNQRYVRPTIGCESNASEIIALANDLGAFQKSDREYAEACFKWVQRNIRRGLPMQGALGTLKNGRATCADETSLLIALCRAGGVPARYRIAREVVTQQFVDGFSQDPITKMLLDAMGDTDIVSVAEIRIGDEWVHCTLGTTPEFAALNGIPIAHFGEDSTDLWTHRKGKAQIREAPSIITTILGKALSKLMGSRIESMNVQFDDNYRRGKKILDESGGIDEYDRKIRKSYRFIMPRIVLKKEDCH